MNAGWKMDGLVTVASSRNRLTTGRGTKQAQSERPKRAPGTNDQRCRIVAVNCLAQVIGTDRPKATARLRPARSFRVRNAPPLCGDGLPMPSLGTLTIQQDRMVKSAASGCIMRRLRLRPADRPCKASETAEDGKQTLDAWLSSPDLPSFLNEPDPIQATCR